MEPSASKQSNVPIEPEPNRECRACCKPIPARAITCTECGSYQNKYVYYILGAANLIKPILELAPIVAIAVSLWAIAFPGTAQIKLKAVCEEKSIYLTAINVGGRVGALTNPQLWEKRDGKVTASNVHLKPTQSGAMSEILKPGDGMVTEYKAEEYGSELSFPSKGDSKECQLLIRFSLFNFSKSGPGESDTEATCPCRE